MKKSITIDDVPETGVSPDEKSPETERLIDRAMKANPGISKRELAIYYHAVHQELAPHARRLEQQRDAAWEELRLIREAISANPEESTLYEVRRIVAKGKS